MGSETTHIYSAHEICLRIGQSNPSHMRYYSVIAKRVETNLGRRDESHRLYRIFFYACQFWSWSLVLKEDYYCWFLSFNLHTPWIPFSLACKPVYPSDRKELELLLPFWDKTRSLKISSLGYLLGKSNVLFCTSGESRRSRWIWFCIKATRMI